MKFESVGNQDSGAGESIRRFRATALVALMALAPALALAQYLPRTVPTASPPPPATDVPSSQPEFTAEMIGRIPRQSSEAASASASASLAPVEELDPQQVVAYFQKACVGNDGQSAAAIDWALSNDFEPTDPNRGTMDSMLDGASGTVLTAPGSQGRVMLVVTERQCAVWAERTSGPPLRSAFAALVGDLGTKGHKTRLVSDRSVERAGAWRNQMQWRYRAPGAGKDLGLGSVTTITSAQGTQVLRLAPIASAAPAAPAPAPMR